MSLDDKINKPSEPIVRISKISYESSSLKLLRKGYSSIRDGILRGYEGMADALRNFEDSVCQRIFYTLLR
jgi:capsid protein